MHRRLYLNTSLNIKERPDHKIPFQILKSKLSNSSTVSRNMGIYSAFPMYEHSTLKFILCKITPFNVMFFQDTVKHSFKKELIMAMYAIYHSENW